jgi:hypothetical protein
VAVSLVVVHKVGGLLGWGWMRFEIELARILAVSIRTKFEHCVYESFGILCGLKKLLEYL